MPKIVKKRQRRAPEDLIAALESKIEAIKARAERKRARANPAIRYTTAAVRNIDKAMATADDNVLRKTLEDARGSLAAYLTMQGVVPAGNAAARSTGGRRSAEDVERMGDSLLAYVEKNPGQRGEDIASGMQSDTKTMRLPMKKLIAEGKVRTKGERRAMRYYPA
jgi:hypothetical protein